MALKPLTDISKPIPFQGGMVSKCENAQLPFGGFSDVCNMRAVHTTGGKKTFKQRKGQLEKNTTAITGTTVKILSLFHFSKGQRSENHFFAQTDDGDIYDATHEPENGKQTTATFGTEVFSGSASQIPGSWSVLDDLLIHSNGVDQHKIYAGSANYVEALIKYDGAATPPTIPTVGIDYTKEVTDGLSATYAVLDDLDVFGNHECLFIYSPIRINRLYWTIPTGNTDMATGSIWYRKKDNTWVNTVTSLNFVDMTKGTDTTLSTSGAMYWDLPGDEVPSFMYGRVGFWYMFQTSAQFVGETVHITDLTYGTDHDAAGTRTSFIDLVNVWSGESLPVIQTIFYDDSANAKYTSLLSKGYKFIDPFKEAVYLIASGDLTSIGDMTTSDYVYFFTLDQIQGIYIDVGDTPNTEPTTSFATNDISVWCGADFQSVGTLSDQTSGLGNSGWITWARAPYNTTYYPQKTMGDTGTIGTTPYYGYLYRFKVSTATVSAGVQISIETLPFFDRLHLTDTTPDAGVGFCNSKWKDRMCYTFDRYPNQIYVSAKGRPMVLNGPDFAILKAGDGRANKVVCMWPFHNELAVWQEEKGDEGGTLTLWQGDNPSEFSRGKLVLSTKHGTFNAKSAIVVDGIKLPGADTLKTIMFWIGTGGVFMSDGTAIWGVSDDIEDLFDSTVTNSLRRGYENDHWIGYDRTYHIIRIGLVTGTGTLPNTFRVLDLKDFAWYKDNPAQELSCIVEAEGNSTGKVPVLQYGGGVDDGKVYQLNYGTNDVSTLIDSYIQMEFYHHGLELEMGNILVGMKVQAAVSPGTGSCTVTPYANAVAQTALSLLMTLENTSETVRRHKTGVGVASEQLSLKLQNNAATEEIHLFDVAVEINANVDK